MNDIRHGLVCTSLMAVYSTVWCAGYRHASLMRPVSPVAITPGRLDMSGSIRGWRRTSAVERRVHRRELIPRAFLTAESSSCQWRPCGREAPVNLVQCARPWRGIREYCVVRKASTSLCGNVPIMAQNWCSPLVDRSSGMSDSSEIE